MKGSNKISIDKFPSQTTLGIQIVLKGTGKGVWLDVGSYTISYASAGAVQKLVDKSRGGIVGEKN